MIALILSVLAITLANTQAVSLGSDVSINIVNGDNPNDPHSYPYVVLIKFSNGKNYCNGVLISANYVLTSGICMTHTPVDYDTTVELGVYDLSCPETTRVTVRIERVLVHPKFRYESYVGAVENNIAIITLGNPVAFSSSIRAAIISTSSSSYVGQYARTCGWGSTLEDGTGYFNHALLTFANKVIDLGDCKALSTEANDNSICVSDDLGQRLGSWDDGAPLIINGYLVGIASQPRLSVAVFTRISPYVDWIINNSDVKV